MSKSFKFELFLKFYNYSNQMEPKKDVSTAILDQKKAPNKLLVNYIFIQVD